MSFYLFIYFLFFKKNEVSYIIHNTHSLNLNNELITSVTIKIQLLHKGRIKLIYLNYYLNTKMSSFILSWVCGPCFRRK